MIQYLMVSYHQYIEYQKTYEFVRLRNFRAIVTTSQYCFIPVRFLRLTAVESGFFLGIDFSHGVDYDAPFFYYTEKQ